MTVVGYTTGVYDMFHIGHLNLLRQARERCDRLIVGVTTDELSESRKGKTPIIPFIERRAIIESIRYVDEVVPQEHMDKFAAWRALQFDVMFVGDDWRGTPSWVSFEQELATVGARVEYLPYTMHTSSTMLRTKLFGSETA